MEDRAYELLRSRLDMFPTSFPKTEEGIEFRILKRLFTEEEAEIAGNLPLKGKEDPEGIDSISHRMGKPADILEPLLEAMAGKGLVYVKGDKGAGKFALLPFMPGIYEFNFDRVDAELADLLDTYMTRHIYRETAKSKSPIGRIIPVAESVSAQAAALPFEDVAEIIETSSSIAVTPCICRTKKKALNKGCDYPMEACLYFNDYADYLNSVGKGRKLTKQEALELLKETEAAGLVHNSLNLQETEVICSCCSCCCEGLKGLIKLAHMERLDLGPEVNFKLVLDEEQCTLCETCIERCLTGALTVTDDRLVLNSARCIGCGLCVSTCPSEALCLERKPLQETSPTPDDLGDMFTQMGWREA